MTEYIKAKEYLKAQCEKRKDSLVLEMPQNYITDVEQAFIDGYHEGFKDCAKSRLNITTISDCPIKDEWHYVKDGEYPTDDKKVLCILGDFENDNLEVGYYSQVEGDSKRWRFEDYDLPDDSEEGWGVSAWKEIVLPELSKEIE